MSRSRSTPLYGSPPPVPRFDDPSVEEARARREFADPGGRSALRAGTRNRPCPTCRQPNRLTAKDVALGYQCDRCADRDEGFGW